MATELIIDSSFPLDRSERKISNAVLGVSVFILTEVMFFTALISAFLVIKAGVPTWAPPENIQLPILVTAFNTLVLTVSGLLLYLAAYSFPSKDAKSKTESYYLASLICAVVFVVIQGSEWVELLKYGMTMSSGIFAACFFLIIGSHGLHAISAILVMAFYFLKLKQGKMTIHQLRAIQIYWYFIVAVWPILYGLIYF